MKFSVQITRSSEWVPLPRNIVRLYEYTFRVAIPDDATTTDWLNCYWPAAHNKYPVNGEAQVMLEDGKLYLAKDVDWVSVKRFKATVDENFPPDESLIESPLLDELVKAATDYNYLSNELSRDPRGLGSWCRARFAEVQAVLHKNHANRAAAPLQEPPPKDIQVIIDKIIEFGSLRWAVGFNEAKLPLNEAERNSADARCVELQDELIGIYTALVKTTVDPSVLQAMINTAANLERLSSITLQRLQSLSKGNS